MRVFNIIERFRQTQPRRVVEYVKDHPRDLRPLCELVASIKSNEAGCLLHSIAVANEVIFPKIPQIKLRDISWMHEPAGDFQREFLNQTCISLTISSVCRYFRGCPHFFSDATVIVGTQRAGLFHITLLWLFDVLDETAQEWQLWDCRSPTVIPEMSTFWIKGHQPSQGTQSMRSVQWRSSEQRTFRLAESGCARLGSLFTISRQNSPTNHPKSYLRCLCV
jgi:hypothetical protein